MLFYNRMLELEGVDANCTCLDTSRECNICHFYFFKDRNILYQPHFAMDARMLHYALYR